MDDLLLDYDRPAPCRVLIAVHRGGGWVTEELMPGIELPDGSALVYLPQGPCRVPPQRVRPCPLASYVFEDDVLAV